MPAEINEAARQFRHEGVEALTRVMEAGGRGKSVKGPVLHHLGIQPAFTCVADLCAQGRRGVGACKLPGWELAISQGWRCGGPRADEACGRWFAGTSSNWRPSKGRGAAALASGRPTAALFNQRHRPDPATGLPPQKRSCGGWQGSRQGQQAGSVYDGVACRGGRADHMHPDGLLLALLMGPSLRPRHPPVQDGAHGQRLREVHGHRDVPGHLLPRKAHLGRHAQRIR